MKKIFTLIAAAFMAVGANAQDMEDPNLWFIPKGELSTADGLKYNEGAMLLDNDYAKITTANNDAAVRMMQDESQNPIKESVGGYEFAYGINVRVDKSPTAENPTGTPHTGDDGNANVAIVVAAKKNTDVIFYVKVGAAKTFDGYDQTSNKAVAGERNNENPDDPSWHRATITYQLKGGNTYTFSTRGGTTTLFAIETQPGSYSSESTDGIYRVNFNGADNETPEGFFSYEGNHNFNTKFTGTYDGVTYTKGLKMEGSTVIKFTTEGAAGVLIVQSTWSEATLTLDDVELPFETATTPADSEGCRAYTTTVAAGTHVLKRTAAESGLFYIAVDTNGGDTDGIKDATSENVAAKAVKMMKDGRLVIVKGGAEYSVSGTLLK